MLTSSPGDPRASRQQDGHPLSCFRQQTQQPPLDTCRPLVCRHPATAGPSVSLCPRARRKHEFRAKIQHGRTI